MNMKTMFSITLVLVLSIIAVSLHGLFAGGRSITASITDFESCAKVTGVVMESYPRQCLTADGRTFTEIIDEPITMPIQNANAFDGCAIGGCSGQVCGESSEVEGLVTTCEYRAEYGCYQYSRCERQTSGKCGWSKTPELTQCMLGVKEMPLGVPSDIKVQ